MQRLLETKREGKDCHAKSPALPRRLRQRFCSSRQTANRLRWVNDDGSLSEEWSSWTETNAIQTKPRHLSTLVSLF